MFTRKFWTDALERAIKSAAQGALTAGVFDQAGVIGTDWVGVASIAGGMALASVLTSLVSSQVGDPDSASITPEVTDADHEPA